MTTCDFNPVLVTGGAGFIGAAAIERLLADGVDVHALLRPDADTWRLRDMLGRVRRHDVDLVDGEAVAAAVRTARPTAVVHLATHGAYESQADAQRILSTNILGTFHLLDASLAAGWAGVCAAACSTIVEVTSRGAAGSSANDAVYTMRVASDARNTATAQPTSALILR